MRAIIVCVLLLFAPSAAHAICVYTPVERQVESAHVAFIATLVSGEVQGSLRSLNNGQKYRINYSFLVRERIKGDPAQVKGLYVLGTYYDPRAKRQIEAAEEVRLVPGDTVLVIADGESHVQISFCSPSRLWNEGIDPIERPQRRASNNSFKPNLLRSSKSVA